MANLPALAETAVDPAQFTPTITTTSAVDSWTVHLGPVNATISYTYDPDGSDIRWSTVFVDSDLAESADPQLAQLANAERNLGDHRWLDRDIDSDVDSLYDRLNERIGVVETMLAAAVLPKLTAVIDDDGDRMLRGLEFSAYAGCTSCKCSPGVKAPHVHRYGQYVDIHITSAA